MGRRVVVTGGDSLRRATVFAVVFGGAIGLTAWLAGGLRGKSAGGGDDEPDGPAPLAPAPGSTAQIAPNLSVGDSSDVVLSHDSDSIVGGKPVRWRAWTIAWKTASPRKSADPDVGVQDVTAPHVVVYPEPQRADEGAVLEGAQGTTRVVAQRGVVSYQKEVRTDARLEGDVRLDRFGPKKENDDLHLRTNSLDVSLLPESKGAPGKRRAQTADPVTIEGGRIRLEGKGLDGELFGTDCRATLLSDVKGRFDATAGLTGGPVGGAAKPTEVTCAGACEIVALDKGRGADRRWKVTFHDKVRVAQGESSLVCDLLEVEFRMGEPHSKNTPPPERVTATGNVVVKGRTEKRSFEIASQKASHWQEGAVGRETDVVLFEGAPVMNVFGEVGDAKGGERKDGGTRGRLEVRCDGAATMRTNRAGNLATSPYRTHVQFEKNVIVRQWEDEKADDAKTELRAPKVTLFGTRWENGQFQPDTMTAEGGVTVKRPEFASRSDGATWERLPQFGIDRYLLVGNPQVNCANVGSLPLFGKAKKREKPRATLTAADNVRVDLYEERPPEKGRPPRPYATVSAGPRAVLTQIADGTEISRLTAQQIDATIAPGPQLQHAEAVGAAHVWGLADDGGSRDVYGAKILLDELVLPPGAPKDAPHPAQVTVLGEGGAQAVAAIREKDGRVHDVRADMLRYDQDGSVVTASRGVTVTMSVAGDKAGSGVSRAVEGPIKMTAQDMRLDLQKPEQGSADKPQLRKVTATGNVFIDGKLSRVEGAEAVFDAMTGIAEVKGRPARVVYAGESSRYTSFIASELIRAYFDMAPGAKKQGDLLRASCPNGGAIIRYFDPPGPDGKFVPGRAARRMQINSAGPIDATRTDATAVNDVRADMWSLAPSGEWTIAEGTIYAERAKMAFDVNAPGQVKDRIRTFDASGTDGRQVVVDLPNQFHGRADRVVTDFTKNKMHFSTNTGADVYVREIATGRQLMYQSATFDFVTHEWTDQVNAREQEPGK